MFRITSDMISRKSTALFISALCVALAARTQEAPSSVRVWEEPLTLPTYLAGAPEINPIFYTNESYQGAQKHAYPYPMQDNLTNVKEDRTYTSLNLENEYIKLTVLPEIGGRLFAATDKTNGYDFFYRQHVIKPALIGMLGAWISGGVEWCVFHHHRNTTFMPVDYTLAENPDGSKTIWFGEIERRHRMKWTIGLTLYPGKSYIEATVKFFNPTEMPNSMLYWANVAVHVNDDYQVLFPPSVQVATYHSKIDFTHWPISQEIYRGSDYKGVDISWWKNSPSSNSFFAWHIQEDFMGGYDHGRDAGMVHTGNHNIVTGAKLWEWGTGPRGRSWDDILTDDDGPYAELMVGGYSDNQPDYSWIKPHEVKTLKQYWYPVRGIGGFKNANLNAAVNLEMPSNNEATLAFHVTSPQPNARIELRAKGDVVFTKKANLDPGHPFRETATLPDNTGETELQAVLLNEAGEELVSYQPVHLAPVEKLPEVVQAPPKPADIPTIEELYFTGVRVEQIYNPTVDPMIYYEEALKRDPYDSRTNTITGIHYNKRGMFAKAEEYFRRAAERTTIDYTRPANTEAFYQLGVSLRGQHREAEAVDAFYRASWDTAFRAQAYFELAELSCAQGKYAEALEQIEESIAMNTRDTRAQNLKVIILRKLGRTKEALAAAKQTQALDALDLTALNEIVALLQNTGKRGKAKAALAEWRRMSREDVQAYLECATGYLSAGCLEDAAALLERAAKSEVEATKRNPLVQYYLGYIARLLGDDAAARRLFRQGAALPTDYVFPFRLETIGVLTAALEVNPKDSRAQYYLGNLHYETQPERAIAAWEAAAKLDPGLALAQRNLGWAYYRTRGDIPEATAAYERAVAANQADPRLYLELDRLYELGNAAPERRLALFAGNHGIVKQRQESFTRAILVQVLNGHYDEAIADLDNNHFAGREGSADTHDIYADAHLLRGMHALKEGDAAAALEHFVRAAEYPENLSVGQPESDPRAAQLAYCTGLAYEALGNADRAKAKFQEAAGQHGERGGDSQTGAENRYCQGMSLLELGHASEAQGLFARLVEDGKRQLGGDAKIDFFAKFGEQNTKQSRAADARYTLALGLLGQGKTEEARKELEAATALNRSHLWAQHHLDALED